MSDLIKRQDAIAVIKKNDYRLKGCGLTYEIMLDQIKAIPSADRPQGWIPCSERLPNNFNEDETVLATTDVDGDRVIMMFAVDVKTFYLKGYVSAWMPLPEPWKGADDERGR